MKIDGWEWRTLPEDKERLVRWRLSGGSWMFMDVHGVVFMHTHEGLCAKKCRPLNHTGDPFPWDEWAEKTHPDPPEGYERRGAWTELTQAGRERKAMATTLLDDGRIIPEGWFFTHVGYACTVEQVAPPVTWADVPEGWYIEPSSQAGWLSLWTDIASGTRLGSCVGVMRNTAKCWEIRSNGGAVGEYSSQPAAIVALIKAAGGEG